MIAQLIPSIPPPSIHTPLLYKSCLELPMTVITSIHTKFSNTFIDATEHDAQLSTPPTSSSSQQPVSRTQPPSPSSWPPRQPPSSPPQSSSGHSHARAARVDAQRYHERGSR
uniref:Uncharacterized protein n=1 Tax=Photinus pyralis TaxID=7054 RepID=A0A1Y1MSH7_PHOPY